MNIHYPVSAHVNRSLLWLLGASMILTSLFLATRIMVELQMVEFSHPATGPANLALPRFVPVPQPPQHQPAPTPQLTVTSAPPVAQLLPVPQPIPTPPPAQ